MYPATSHFAAYSFYDYMDNDLFRRWVQEPTPEGNIFFSQVLLAYPAQRKPMREARLLLLIFKSAYGPSGEKHPEQLHEKSVRLLGYYFE